MSDKKTVFAIMRDLDVDYDTIVEIAQSAKINVIKSPNTEVSPRHLKKILAAAERYKASQANKEQPSPQADQRSELPPFKSISLEELNARTGVAYNRPQRRYMDTDATSPVRKTTRIPPPPPTDDYEADVQTRRKQKSHTYKDQFARLQTILRELQQLTANGSGDIDHVLNLIEEASTLYKACHDRMKRIEQNLILKSDDPIPLPSSSKFTR